MEGGDALSQFYVSPSMYLWRWSCSVVCGFLSLHLLATAIVAVSWMPLATTVQLVRRLECWVGVLRWSQPLPEFAGRPQGRPDSRRLEVVADGLPLFHGTQLAVDTTLVSPVGRDGLPCPRCAREWSSPHHRQTKRTYPELTGRFGLAKLVVLACEVGGSTETRAFLRSPRVKPAPNQSPNKRVPGQHGSVGG